MPPITSEQLLTNPEGETLEFKRDLPSLPSLPPILRTVSACANTAGGTIVLGVEDKTRSVRGMANPLREEERLANTISDGIRPQILVEIELASFRKLSLLVLKAFRDSLSTGITPR